MQAIKLIKPTHVLLTIVLSTVILIYGKPLLVPICFAALLSMLLLPIVKWLQRKGMSGAIAVLLSMLLLFLALAGVIALISWQMTSIASDATDLEKQITAKFEDVQRYIMQTFGVSVGEQNKIIESKRSSSSGSVVSKALGALANIGSFITDFILTTVYIFLFIYFRDRIKGFLIRIVPDSQNHNVEEIINRSQRVTQKYLGGLAAMIVMLWVLYGIGFSVAGVKNPIFFAILCGMLEIVPFIGNLTGTALTILMSLAQGGDANLIIAILVIYAVVQFLQTYLIEPLVVGSEVNINPMTTIIGLVIGELLWGIPGMILAIPLIGILKIICDHIPALQPFGYLMGQPKKDDSSKWKNKLKNIFKRKRKP